MARRLIFSLLIAVSAALAALPAIAADGSLEITPKATEAPGAPDAPKIRLYGASKALVIGIDNYGSSGGWFGPGASTGWPKLAMAIKDAEEVAKALQAAGFTVTLLKDLKADDLDRVFRDFFIKEGSDPEARLFVWFAGHGHTVGGEGYLVPADASHPKDDIEFRGKALSLRRFGEYMREARAKHVLAVFDSCFAGTVFNVARAAPPPAITYSTGQPVRQFVSSGEAEQEVSDDGTFRRLFVDALDGKERDADPNRDGFITGTELGQFLFDKVTNLTRTRQTPRYGKLNALGFDRGDFVLQTRALTAPGVAAPAPPASPQATAPQTLSEAAQAWALVQSSDDLSVLEAFRKQYGTVNAFYDRLAAARIEDIGKRSAAAAAKADEERKTQEAERARAAAEAERKQREADAAAAAAAEAARKAEEQRKADAAKADTERQRVALLQKPEAEKTFVHKAAELSPGETFRDCPECPEMVVIPAGEYLMGSSNTEIAALVREQGDTFRREGPQHKVSFARQFAAGKFEVTFAEWEVCVSDGVCKSNSNPSDEGWGRGKRPIVNVSWHDAKEYVAWLSEKTGATYRLPTEAEWEYVARAGTSTKYSLGSVIAKSQAQFSEGAYGSAGKTSEVGSFKPNPFGLYDVHGNVWEWTEDCLRNSYDGAPSDGSAALEGDCAFRVLRGGSWNRFPEVLRSAFRFSSQVFHRYRDYGFRVCRTLGNPSID